MPGLGEEVYRGKAFGFIAVAGEEGGVAGEGFGVAADVDDAARGHFGYSGDTFRRAACARRVEEYDVRVQALACGGGHPLGSVGANKFGVRKFIMPCVGGGVLDGVRVALHADDLPRVGRGAQADGADAAVGIDHGLFAGQLCGVQRGAVKHLGLLRVDLVKTAGRDGKLQPAQRVQHKTGAIEDLFAVAQHGAAECRVDILHDTDDPRRFFAQCRAEITAAGQLRPRRDQCDQHLPLAGAAQHHVAQKTGALVLIKGGVAAGAGGILHGGQCTVEHLVLQQAVGGRQHLVRALGIQPADQLALLGGKAGNRLVAVVPWLGHRAQRGHRGKAA